MDDARIATYSNHRHRTQRPQRMAIRHVTRSILGLTICCICSPGVWALDPNESVARFFPQFGNRKMGCPRIRFVGIVQTSDGYPWDGTEERLVRFDGYDFTVFNKDNGDLPSRCALHSRREPTGRCGWEQPPAWCITAIKSFATTTGDGLSVI